MKTTLSPGAEGKSMICNSIILLIVTIILTKSDEISIEYTTSFPRPTISSRYLLSLFTINDAKDVFRKYCTNNNIFYRDKDGIPRSINATIKCADNLCVFELSIINFNGVQLRYFVYVKGETAWHIAAE